MGKVLVYSVFFFFPLNSCTEIRSKIHPPKKNSRSSPAKEEADKIISSNTATDAPKIKPNSSKEKSDSTSAVQRDPRVNYDRTSSFNYIRRTFMKEKVLEQISNSIAKAYILPKQITISMEECGEVAAYYDSKRSSIVMCYEMIEDLSLISYEDRDKKSDTESSPSIGFGCGFYGAFDGDFSLSCGFSFDDYINDDDYASDYEDDDDDYYGPNYVFDEDPAEIFSSMTLLILYHEIGHALIDILELPITGKEEDAADQFAAISLIGNDGDASSVLNSSIYFASTTDDGALSYFWDEHSTDEQRFFNLMCWAYGSDPAKYAFIVRDYFLPYERSQNCQTEFDATRSAWLEITQKHMQPKHKTKACSQIRDKSEKLDKICNG